MKKIFLAILFFVSLQCFGQLPQSIGSPNSRVFIPQGGFFQASGLAPFTYTDTTAANTANYIKNYPGILITTSSDNILWRRNQATTAWEQIASGGAVTNDWRITGNSGTNITSNFLGTTDNQDLGIRRNNALMMRFKGSDSISLYDQNGLARTTFYQKNSTASGIRFIDINNDPLLFQTGDGYLEAIGTLVVRTGDSPNPTLSAYGSVGQTVNLFEVIAGDPIPGDNTVFAVSPTGNVGIGISTPAVKLHVQGADTIRFNGSGSGASETTAKVIIDTILQLYKTPNDNQGRIAVTQGDILHIRGGSTLGGVLIFPNPYAANGPGTIRFSNNEDGFVDQNFFAGNSGSESVRMGLRQTELYFEAHKDTLGYRMKSRGPTGVFMDSTRLMESYGTTTAAANNLTLPYNGNTVDVSGNTQINAITTYSWQAGSVVRLRFTGTPTVKDNTAGGAGTAPIQLVGGVDFTAAAGDILQLVYNGTDWIELARTLISGGGGGGGSSDTTYANVLEYGAISNDGLNDTWAFIAAKNTRKTVLVPPGIFNIDTSFTLFAGQRIMGMGSNSVLHTDSLPTVTPYAMIVPADSCVIENLRFTGSGYAAYNSGPVFTMQNAIHLTGNYVTVRGCYFDSLRGSGVIMYEPALSLVYNNKIHDNTFTNNAVGVFDYANSEYTTIINNTMRLNDYNVMLFGGNHRVVGNALDYSHTAGIYLKGNTNGDHGTIVGNSINHSDNHAIWIVDCPIGEVLSGNNVFFGNITISESDDVVLDNTGMSTVTVNVSATGSTKTTFFNGGYIDGVTFNKTGTGEIMKAGLLERNHAIYNLDADSINLRTNGYSRLFFDGAGKVVFGNEASPNMVTQVDIKTSSNLGGMGNSGLRISDVFAGPNVVLTPVTGNLLGVYNTSSSLTGIIFSEWVNGNDGATISNGSGFWRVNTDNFGIGVTPSSKLHVDGTVQFDNLGTVITDTSTYKPLVIDASGNVRPATYWYGGSGGSLDTLVVTNVGAGMNTGYASNDTIFFERLQAGANVTLTKNADSSITIATTGVVTTLAAIGASPNANGATISGSTLNLQPASASFGGVLTTGSQQIAGAKDFTGQPTFSFFSINGVPYFGSGGLLSQSSSLEFNGTELKVGGAADAGAFNFQVGNGNAYFAQQVSYGSQTLTDGATVTWNWNSGLNATVTLGGNRTLSITNAVAGTYATLVVIQDGTGSRTLTLPANSLVVNGGAGAITLSTAAASKDVLTAYYNGTNWFWSYGKNYN